MTLPQMIESPGEIWTTEFPKAAREFAEYPTEYHDLESALAFAGACLNEVLDGSRAEGVWQPGRGWI